MLGRLLSNFNRSSNPVTPVLASALVVLPGSCGTNPVYSDSQLNCFGNALITRLTVAFRRMIQILLLETGWGSGSSS